MGFRIATNVQSLSAQRTLGVTREGQNRSLEKLSAGERIVRAGDDAAGLAISEKLKAEIRSMRQANRNANDGISLIQTAEGGLNEIQNILIRLRELGIQAASDNIGDQERGYLNLEAKQLIEESDRIAKTTRFGDKVLLDGSGGEMQFHVGAFGGEENVIKYSLSSNATTSELGINSVDVGDKDTARDALQTVDEALQKVGAMRASFGSIQSRLNATTSNLDIQHENLSAANSRIRDTDVAKETAEMASAQVLQNAAVSVLAQANAFPSVALKLMA
jgi:flagellin